MLIRTKITKNLFYIFILIVVGFIFTSCRESQHNIVKVDKVPSSCIENGIDEHYKCTNCDKLFLDEKGETEVTLEDLALEVLDHDVTEFCLEDKYCNRCEKLIEEAKEFHNDHNLDGVCDDCASEVDATYHKETNAN